MTVKAGKNGRAEVVKRVWECKKNAYVMFRVEGQSNGAQMAHFTAGSRIKMTFQRGVNLTFGVYNDKVGNFGAYHFEMALMIRSSGIGTDESPLLTFLRTYTRHSTAQCAAQDIPFYMWDGGINGRDTFMFDSWNQGWDWIHQIFEEQAQVFDSFPEFTAVC